ncbi:ParB/RepB/Spo0J family partition protein [Nocardiopsis sp. NPDC006938]|uniref:ParB/RepB/Spo0J family partition protein n=1 Tax=Nocardiopsis sp. NPDC006938 TaxID=3364337 RepID=UPI0036D1C451
MSRNRKIEESSSFGKAASARRQVISRTAGGFPADLTSVSIEDLVGNPENRRDLGDLQELADSLTQHGLRQPVGVIPSDDFSSVFPQHKATVQDAVFVVINGNRRLAAARMAGVPTLAVHVIELADSSAVRIAVLVENIHRKDMDPLEEAEAVRELVSVYGSNAEVGRQLNKSKVWVGQRLALLGLTPVLKDALRQGSLRIKDGRRLGPLAPEDQQAEWEKIVNPVYPSPSGDDERNSEGGVNPVYPSPSEDEAPGPSTEEEKTPGVGPKKLIRDADESDPLQPAEPVQLTLELQWEATMAAKKIVAAYGMARAQELAAAILDVP